MGRYRLTRHIEAPPERVYDALVEPATMKDWMDLQEVADLTGRLDVPGTRYTQVVRGPWRFRTEIVQAERPTLHEQAGRGPWGASFRMIATLSPSDGGTELELETNYGLPLGPIGRLIDRLWLERQRRTIANRELDRLVALVEAAGG